MGEDLIGKNILFIGPKTFHYENEIIKCLQRKGGSVDYYNDRPFESNLKKVLLRLIPVLLKREVKSYFLSIVKRTEEIQYDYVFCIKLECFPFEVLKKLREQQKKARFIFYTWDSFLNNPNPLKCLSAFDRSLTFDRRDAQSNDLLHRPLFYISEYADIKEEMRTYDVLFVGSVHTQRFKFINHFLQNVDRKYKCYMHLFVPSKILFFARKIFLFPTYGRSQARDFKFSSLSQGEVVSLFAKSKAILDIGHHNQVGLTMRTVEALGAKRKLITNNIDIKNYDFYDPCNIFVYEDDWKVLNDFFSKEYAPICPELYNRYSIDGWVDEIFELKYSSTAVR